MGMVSQQGLGLKRGVITNTPIARTAGSSVPARSYQQHMETKNE